MHEIELFFLWLLSTGKGKLTLPAAVALNLLILRSVTSEWEMTNKKEGKQTEIDFQNLIAPRSGMCKSIGYITV